MPTSLLFIVFLKLLALPSIAETPEQPQKTSSFFSNDITPIETNAAQVILIDYTSGKVLFQKNAITRMVPSSMTKIATLFVVFKYLKSGKLKLTDTFKVSEKAWRLQGSKMFLPLDSLVTVEDLIRGASVPSGNDACVAIAEGIFGTEDAFAKEMTKIVKEIGAQETMFLNASGWPEEGHYSTAKDLAIIAVRTLHDFPEYYGYYKEKEFTYHGIKQGNRNPLLYSKLIEGDGLKTGHTEQGGYGLVGSALQNGRRLILVANGYTSMSDRAKDTESLMAWGFRETELVKIYNSGDRVKTINVWQGDDKTVELIAPKNIAFVVPRGKKDQIQIELVYSPIVKAPFKRGDILGQLVVRQGTGDVLEFPLVANKDIEKEGYFAQIGSALKYLFTGNV